MEDARGDSGFGGGGGSDRENRAERADLAAFGGTGFSPGPTIGDFASFSSPQGLLGLFGQWGPFASNNYGSWNNVSAMNVARDLGAFGRAGFAAMGNPMAGFLSLGSAMPGIMGRNQGFASAPGGYAGQSYDPSASRAGAAATPGEGGTEQTVASALGGQQLGQTIAGLQKQIQALMAEYRMQDVVQEHQNLAAEVESMRARLSGAG